MNIPYSWDLWRYKFLPGVIRYFRESWVLFEILISAWRYIIRSSNKRLLLTLSTIEMYITPRISLVPCPISHEISDLVAILPETITIKQPRVSSSRTNLLYRLGDLVDRDRNIAIEEYISIEYTRNRPINNMVLTFSGASFGHPHSNSLPNTSTPTMY